MSWSRLIVVDVYIPACPGIAPLSYSFGETFKLPIVNISTSVCYGDFLAC